MIRTSLLEQTTGALDDGLRELRALAESTHHGTSGMRRPDEARGDVGGGRRRTGRAATATRSARGGGDARSGEQERGLCLFEEHLGGPLGIELLSIQALEEILGGGRTHHGET